MSAAGARDLAAALDHKRPLIDFVGKRSHGRALLAERDALKAALAGIGAVPGTRLTILLPNCPAAIAGLLAGIELGLEVSLADPRAAEESLRRSFKRPGPEIVLTADLAIVLDRLLRLETEAQVLVARLAQMLPFPRNILTPLLRGSGLAQLPELPNYHELRSVKGAAPQADTAPATRLRLAEGEVSLATLLAMARSHGLPERWILGAPLAESRALILTLASLRQGKLALLTPRLDTATLGRMAKKNGAAVLPAGSPAHAVGA